MPRNTKTVESQSSYSQRLACHFSGASPDRVPALQGWAKAAKATPQRIKNSPDDRNDTL